MKKTILLIFCVGLIVITFLFNTPPASASCQKERDDCLRALYDCDDFCDF